jgi:hypothetical protein
VHLNQVITTIVCSFQRGVPRPLIWGIPESAPRRTWMQAVRAARKGAISADASIRDQMIMLQTRNPYTGTNGDPILAALAVVASAVLFITLVALVAFAGLLTVTATDAAPAIEVAAFVVVTFATGGVLHLIGRRPWLFVVATFLWRLEPPPGVLAVRVHVHEADHRLAFWALANAGFRHVEYGQRDAARLPRRGGPKFPTKCLVTWEFSGRSTNTALPDPARVLNEAGVRMWSVVGKSGTLR